MKENNPSRKRDKPAVFSLKYNSQKMSAHMLWEVVFLWYKDRNNILFERSHDFLKHKQLHFELYTVHNNDIKLHWCNKENLYNYKTI